MVLPNKKKWDDRFYWLISLQYKLAWHDAFTIEEITLSMTPDKVSAIHDAIACGDLKVYTCGTHTVIFKEDVQAFCNAIGDQWFQHKQEMQEEKEKSCYQIRKSHGG